MSMIMFLIAEILCVCMGFAWIFIPINIQMYALFVIFTWIGYILSYEYAISYSLYESMHQINGKISCMFTISQGIGVSIISLILGQFMDKYGAYIQSFSFTTTSILQALVIACILYVQYKQSNKYQIVSQKSQSNILHDVN
eukprot:294454_1